MVVAVDALELADVALDAAAVALVAEAVALVAAAVALVAALVADVVAEAASTMRSHFAESVLLVSGWEPELVCAVFAWNILFVDVSLTRSRST